MCRRRNFRNFHTSYCASTITSYVTTGGPDSILVKTATLKHSFTPELSAEFRAKLATSYAALSVHSGASVVRVEPTFNKGVVTRVKVAGSEPRFTAIHCGIVSGTRGMGGPRNRIIMYPMGRGVTSSEVGVLSSEIVSGIGDLRRRSILMMTNHNIQGRGSIRVYQRLTSTLNKRLTFAHPVMRGKFKSITRRVKLSKEAIHPGLVVAYNMSNTVRFASYVAKSSYVMTVGGSPRTRVFGITSCYVISSLCRIMPRLARLVGGQGRSWIVTCPCGGVASRSFSCVHSIATSSHM